MSVKTSGLARLALRQQVEFLGDGQVSLDSLWRAWGSPAGHDPRSWSELAAPLLAGFAAYRGNLGGTDRSVAMARIVRIWEEESKDPWRSGDLMSHEFIAWAYATYLDTQLGRAASTPTHPLQLPVRS
ncbi:MAG TPA: hypothetical protein VFF52_11585 [Isosphaeraceae bacterium]|nr:hypothetical protein [Isosphaeraceae bacterium]